VVERGGDLVVDRHRPDPLTGRSQATRTYLRGGVPHRAVFSVRMFAYPEPRDWLQAAGFTAAAGYGEDGPPLTAESRRKIMTARR
jgi:hypothetical protein